MYKQQITLTTKEKLRLTSKAIKEINKSFVDYRAGKAKVVKKSLMEILR